MQGWIKKTKVIGLPTNHWIMRNTVFLNKRFAVLRRNKAGAGKSIRHYCDDKNGFWPLNAVSVRKMSYCSSTIRRFAVILG